MKSSAVVDGGPLLRGARPRAVAAIGGAGFAVCMVAGALLSGGTLAYLPPADEIVAAYARDTARILIGTYVLCFGALLLVVHSVGVRDMLGNAAGRPGTLGSLAVAGGSIAAALIIVGASTTFAGTERAAATGIPEGAAVALSDLNGVVLGKAFPMSFALLVGATAVAAWQSQLLPRWLTWASALLTVGLVSPFMWAFVVLVVVWAPLVGFLLGRSGSLVRIVDRSAATRRPKVGSTG